MSGTRFAGVCRVLVVDLVLAWSIDSAELKDTLTATAAYAAILVVFVGSTLPT